LETIERDYADKGVRFFYIYKALAHPENNGYVTPFTIEERLLHVAEAKAKLGTRFEWLCDSMDNDAKHALGDRPNSEFVIDPAGKVVVAREWSRPDELRSDLAKLVGAVEPPTSVQSLNLPSFQPAKSTAASGVVPRIELPGAMQPIKITAEDSGSPHYAKLRAEMNANRVYLGFFLDPLYKVHWNNKSPAIRVKIEPPAGVTVTPDHFQGPKVEAAADSDPREFLVTVSGRLDEPIRVTVNYFACDDAETFCVPIEQTYSVWLERDRDGGSRRTMGSGPAGSGGRMQQMMQRHPVLAAIDLDRDGMISASEVTAAPESLRAADTNRDGKISGRELIPK
jgi:EF hand